MLTTIDKIAASTAAEQFAVADAQLAKLRDGADAAMEAACVAKRTHEAARQGRGAEIGQAILAGAPMPSRSAIAAAQERVEDADEFARGAEAGRE